ncbi:hypothetical protein BH20CHL7_BH20CHL7_06920 [soil metagenome]
MDPGAILERFLDRPRVAYVRAVLDTYGDAAGGLLANGLAFAALFATIPVALVTLGLAGWLAADPRIQAALAKTLIEALPPLADWINGAVNALQTGAPVASVVGIVGLVWTVSQLYVALDVAFARIYSATPARDPFRRTARGFVWVGLLLVGAVAAIVVASMATIVDAIAPDGIPAASAVRAVLTSLPVLAAMAIGTVAVIYRVLPPDPPAWRSVGLPAVVAGLGIVGLSQVFLLVAPRLVGVAALVGTLATAFVALAWLSFTFQVLLYGAAWVRVRDERRLIEAASALSGPAATAESRGGGQ